MAKPTKAPTWPEILSLRRKMLARIPRDEFLRLLLKGCLRVGRDKGNPLRGNFVASGLRELVGHVLHSLAPDEEVRRCVWFEQAKDTKTVTRRQRATYIVQAGLPVPFVEETLEIQVDDWADPLLAAMDELHKATHVRPETLVSSGPKVRTMVYDVMVGIMGLLDAADESRSAVKHAVATVMHDAVFENLISETISELDELSTHTTVDGHWIDTVEVTKLDAKEIGYRINGEVEVELQYGSNSDVRNDIGFRKRDSYPYSATVVCEVTEPMTVKSEDLALSVDNSSFYE